MRKISLIASALLFSLAVMAQPKAEEIAKFNEETHDFGKLKQNVPVTYNFVIKNISDKPIVVESATASCGCTVPEKPTDPIMPGQTASLKVQYNAAAVSPFTKDVYVKFVGVDQPKNLKITGEVLTPEAYDEWVKANPSKETKTKPKN